MKKYLGKGFLFFIICLLMMSIQAFAHVTVENQDYATKSKNVTWWADDASAELRYMSGSHSEADFAQATPAGNGRASIEITENGNYTFFAKSGEAVTCDVVPITTIDNISPDITVTDLVVHEDGTMDVYYSASDYFSSCETRYLAGSAGASSWDQAASMTGGVIKSLKTGVYTLFAKDGAGNVGTYLLTTESNAEKGSSSQTTESKWSKEYENIYSSAELEISSNVKPRSSIIISKCDSETGNQIIGAKLQLKNVNTGKVVEEWTSSDCDRVFYDIDMDAKYVLTELFAPDGYHKAEAIEFYPKHLENATLVMYDKPITRITKAPDNPTPTDPAPTQEIEKLPQTGGFDSSAKMLSFGFMLLLFGMGGFFLINRKIKNER